MGSFLTNGTLKRTIGQNKRTDLSRVHAPWHRAGVGKKPDSERLAERQALGQRLSLGRAYARLSQASVATALGVRRPTIAAWEAGDAEPLAIDLQRLADLYGVEIGVLTGRSPLPPQRPAFKAKSDDTPG
jgi:DNA-binding XRE family transcriptional regulator